MNPELRRNLWTELTLHRLVLAPLLLGLAVLLIVAQAGDPPAAILGAASGAMIVLVHFWGSRRAAEAVTEEVRERTWDWQRLSSLGPWSMTWGKLVGATAFPWYCGALCVVAILVAGSVQAAVPHALRTVVGLVASAIALHGAALAASIQASRKDSRWGGRIGTWLLIPIAFLGAFSVLRGGSSSDGAVRWFGASYGAESFLVASAVVFAAWAVLSAYREMQRELHVRALPWAWPAFALFLGAYVSGFDDIARAGGRGTALVFATFFATQSLAYVGLFVDTTTAMGLRRIVARVRAGDWRRAAEALPLWASMLPVVALFAVLASLQPWPLAWNVRDRFIGPFPLALALLLLRDCGLLVFFALAARARRVEGTTLLYLVLLDSVLPALFTAFGLHWVARVLMPLEPGFAAAPYVAALHVAIIAVLVAARWRRMERSLAT